VKQFYTKVKKNNRGFKISRKGAAKAQSRKGVFHFPLSLCLTLRPGEKLRQDL
jgi:hypothetical protein